MSLFDFDTKTSNDIEQIISIIINENSSSDVVGRLNGLPDSDTTKKAKNIVKSLINVDNILEFKSKFISEFSKYLRSNELKIDQSKYNKVIGSCIDGILKNFEILEKTEDANRVIKDMNVKLLDFASGKTNTSFLEPIRAYILPKISNIVMVLRSVLTSNDPEFREYHQIIEQILKEFDQMNVAEIVSDNENKSHNEFRNGVLQLYDQLMIVIGDDTPNVDAFMKKLGELLMFVGKTDYKKIIDRMLENFRGTDTTMVNNFLRQYNRLMTPELAQKVNIYVAKHIQNRDNNLIDMFHISECNEMIGESLKRLNTKKIRSIVTFSQNRDPSKKPNQNDQVSTYQSVAEIMNRYYGRPGKPESNPERVNIIDYASARKYIDSYNIVYAGLSSPIRIHSKYSSSLRLIPSEYFITEYTERIINTVFKTVSSEAEKRGDLLKKLFDIDDTLDESETIRQIKDVVYRPDFAQLEMRTKSIQSGGNLDRKSIVERLDAMNRPNISDAQKIENIEMCLTILSEIVMENTNLLNDYTKLIGDYSVNYNHIYSYLRFLMLIATNQFFTDNYVIYKYINKGTIEFYRRVMDNMLCDLEKGSDEPHIAFVRKYYYTVVNHLSRFLNKASSIIEKSTDILDVRSVDSTASDLRNALILLNYFKPILESYNEMFQNQITIYARLNDIKTEIDQDEKIFISDMEYRQIKNVRIESPKSSSDGPQCGLQGEGADTSKMITRLSICKPLETQMRDKGNSLEDIENRFTEVFDSVNFPENSDISKYMTLETQLAKKKGVCIMTYGYSGTGKTYTLFGNREREGVLKSTLVNINGLERVDFRLFELYGLGLPYDFYWNTRSGSERDRILDIFHRIYHYNLVSTNDGIKVEGDQFTQANVVSEVSPENFRKYIENLDLANVLGKSDANTTYVSISKELVSNVFGNFSDFTELIDKIRTKAKRIRETPNNPESSRSILVYDFNLFVGSENPEDSVRFMIIDLPGREEISQTYVEPYLGNEHIKNLILAGSNMPQINPESPGKPEDRIDLIKMIITSMALNPLALGVFDCKSVFQSYNSSDLKPQRGLTKRELTNKILNNRVNELDKAVKLDVAFKNDDSGNGNLVLDIKNPLFGFTTKRQYYALATMFIMSELIIAADFENIEMIYRKLTNQLINIPIETAISKLKDREIHSLMINLITSKFKGTKGLDVIQSIVDDLIDKEMIIERKVERKEDKSEADYQNDYAQYLNDRKDVIIAGMVDKLDDVKRRIVELLTYDYLITPFEGVYINENIVGLIDFLSKSLIRDGKQLEFIEEQKKIDVSDLRNTTRIWLMSNELTEMYRDGSVLDKVNELFKLGISIRNGKVMIGNEEMIDYQPLFKKVDNILDLDPFVRCVPSDNEDLQERYRTIGKELQPVPEHFIDLRMDRVKDQQEYMASNYKADRIFNKKKPLIQDILEPYIETNKQGNDASSIKKIKDYKIFYLFGNYDDNQKVQYKCEHQIKLLKNTENFIQAVTPKK